METIKNPVVIYTETTPNPESMKFVANCMLTEPGTGAEYVNPESTGSSPLAAKLFQFPFVRNIFISGNFITLTKIDGLEWTDITTELRDFIRDYIAQGKRVFTSAPENSTEKSRIVNENTPEVLDQLEQKIVGILDEYIRPAVEQDGGAISFKSFKDGVVTVVLQGACSGCPSSTITLKAGIEGLLKRMVPEVESVVC